MKVRCLDVRRRMRLFRDHRRLSLLTKKGFENIFWGVLITVLDFRIVGINLLPDFMGFFLISRGLIQCAEYSWAFVKAKYLEPSNINLIRCNLDKSFQKQPDFQRLDCLYSLPFLQLLYCSLPSFF